MIPDVFWEGIRDGDAWLDANVGQTYKDQPLAQDWARLCKVIEELGEAVAELIAWTSQNPRKPEGGPENFEKMLEEMADVALTAMYGLQHFTKDETLTRSIVEDRLQHHLERVGLR